jgi:hypothetical protein
MAAVPYKSSPGSFERWARYLRSSQSAKRVITHNLNAGRRYHMISGKRYSISSYSRWNKARDAGSSIVRGHSDGTMFLIKLSPK